MSLNQEVELLKNIPLFARVEPSKLKLLAFASERLTFNPGRELFHQGDHADKAYIIIEGDAAVLVDTPNGTIKVATLSKNALVGEIGILCDVPRTATIKAESKVVTLAIARDVFFQMVTEFPQMGVEIMRELARRLERTTAQLTQAVQKN
jgi:CRP-like cAMP-binding protein